MKKENFKLALDKETDRVVHIDEVEEGYKGGVCPDCKSYLIASNRNAESRKKDTYFRHKGDSGCSGETLIHLWAKQVILDQKKVLLAGYTARGSATDLRKQVHTVNLEYEAEAIEFSEVILERGQRNERNELRIPDALCAPAPALLPRWRSAGRQAAIANHGRGFAQAAQAQRGSLGRPVDWPQALR